MANSKKVADVFRSFAAMNLKGAPKPWDIDSVIKVWTMVLSDVDDDSLEIAAVAYMRDGDVCQWWPQPGKLLERVPGAAVAKLDMGDHAWAVFLQMARDHGNYRPPHVPDTYGRVWHWPDDVDGEAMDAAITALGGWVDACVHGDNIPASRKSFRDAYRTAVARKRIATEEGSVLQLLQGHKRITKQETP